MWNGIKYVAASASEWMIIPVGLILLSFPATTQATPLAILHKNCVSCHSEVKRKGGLEITSRESLIKGGDSGEALVPGKAAESYFIETLYPDADSHMPPKKQLSPAEISSLEDWVNAGAKWDNAQWEKLSRPAKTEVTLQKFPTSYNPVMAMALSPDGTTLLCGSGNSIEVYQVQSPSVPGTEPKRTGYSLEHKKSLPGHSDQVQSIAFSPDGKTFVSGGFRRLIFRNAETKEIEQEITTPFYGRITAVAWSPDGKQLIAADSVPALPAKIHVIDNGKRQITRTIENAHDDAIYDLNYSKDGKTIGSASADKMAIIRDTEAFEIATILEGHTGYVLTLAFGPEGNYVATAGDDSAIKIWDTEKGVQTTSFSTRNSGPVGGLFWGVDPDNLAKKQKEKDKEKAAAINTDRVVSINDAGQPGTFVELKTHEGGERSTGARERRHNSVDVPLTSMAYDAENLLLFAGSEDGRIFIWDKAGKKIHETPVKP